MLVSPAVVSGLLSSLVSDDPAAGPHTVLLVTPTGQLLSSATAPRTDKETDDDDEAESGPYLDGPERLRLLLGLASQWDEEESPRMECELGRLLFHSVPLPEPEVPPSGAAVPSIRPQIAKKFLLVLNGQASTPWSSLGSKVDTFKQQWN